MRSPRLPVLWGIAALALAPACERNEAPSHGEDASTDAGEDAGDPFQECSLEAQACGPGQSCSLYLRDAGLLGTRCFPAACQLVAQDCDGGLKCTFVEDGGVAHRACVEDGDAGEGEPCTPTAISNTCARGLVCVPVRHLDGGVENRCLRFCEKNTDCASGQACYLTLLLAGNPERPLVCARPCDLFQQDCPPNEACYPGPNVPGCYLEGDRGLGESCVSSNECVRGAACVGHECVALCAYPSGPPACATGTCNRLDYAGAADAGVCL